MDREQSLIILPLFDSTNYEYWKVRMRAFLQSLNEQVWQAIEIGWIKPIEALVDWFSGRFPPKFFTMKLVYFIDFPGSSYLVLFNFSLCMILT